MSSIQKYRLLTRSDFDGLICAVLLKELDLIDDIKRSPALWFVNKDQCSGNEVC